MVSDLPIGYIYMIICYVTLCYCIFVCVCVYGYICVRITQSTYIITIG